MPSPDSDDPSRSPDASLGSSRRVTLRDLARETGFSVATVSMALRHAAKIPLETRQTIQAAAATLGYQSSEAVSRALRAVRTKGRTPFRTTIACISASIPLNEEVDRWQQRRKRHLPIPYGLNQLSAFASGLHRQSTQVGVQFDHFSLLTTPATELPGILHNRGITTAILFLRGADLYTIDALFHGLARFHLVILGPCLLPHPPGVIVGCDLFEAGRLAFFQAWRTGYRHLYLLPPPLIIDPQRRFAAGLFSLAESVPGQKSVSLLTPLKSKMLLAPEAFAKLSGDDCVVAASDPLEYLSLLRHHPDSDHGPGFVSWHANVVGPTDIQPLIAGINQRDEDQARVAVDAAVNASYAPPTSPFDSAIEFLLDPNWHAGESLTPRPNPAINLLEEMPFPIPPGHGLSSVQLPPSSLVPLTKSASWRSLLKVVPLLLGSYDFHGIPFTIAPAPPQIAKGHPGILLLASSSIDKLPSAPRLRSRVVIPLNQRVAALYFLHTCRDTGELEPVARYTISYAAGGAAVLELRVKGPQAHLLDCHGRPSGLCRLHSRPVCLLDTEWQTGDLAWLSVTEWKNPRPHRRVRNLTITTNPKATPIFALLALTLASG